MSNIENQRRKIRELFAETEMTLDEIAAELGTTYKVVQKETQRAFPDEYRRERKRGNYRRSKTGAKNPMWGKMREAHHNYKGEVASGNGYIMVLKPDWYTARRTSKHVFKHTVVMCEALGLTEMPKGWEIHHIDRDKTNNDLSNLALLTSRAHTRLHQLERATTIPKGSRGLVTSEVQSNRRA